MRKYQQCVNCIMDTSDSKIKFDHNGFCDYCFNYKVKIPNQLKESRELNLANLVEKIKSSGKNKKYDCIIGLSGGADSSYLLYYAVKVLKLRPLAYSVDTGWNLNVAIENIEKLVKGLDVDLFTEVLNWAEMKDLQRSFLMSNLPYQDLPQDHVIFAGLYNYAVKNNIKYVLTGANNNTEGVRPPIEWVYLNDLTLIKGIHKKFGSLKLKSLPFAGMIKYKILYQYIFGMKRVYLLDLIDYNKNSAEDLLKKEFSWQKYENKHYENVFTRFYEGYYLPVKFNFDKRKCYLSNLILSGQLSKAEALEQISNKPYDPNLMKKDLIYISKKLDFSVDQLNKIIEAPGKSYKDYKNSFLLLKFLIRIAQFLKIENREFR